MNNLCLCSIGCRLAAIYIHVYTNLPHPVPCRHTLLVWVLTLTQTKRKSQTDQRSRQNASTKRSRQARSLSSRLVTSPRRMQCNIMYLLSRRLLASTIQYTNVTLYQFPPLPFHCRIFSTPYALSLSFEWWWCVFTFLKHTF